VTVAEGGHDAGYLHDYLVRLQLRRAAAELLDVGEECLARGLVKRVRMRFGELGSEMSEVGVPIDGQGEKECFHMYATYVAYSERFATYVAGLSFFP
jgi:hypothetical protein